MNIVVNNPAATAVSAGAVARHLGPNIGLVGRPGSRAALDTPCLVLDVRRLEANIATAVAITSRRGVALRPHAKSHKCSAIAHRQVAAGARGVCVATVGEAEALAGGGVADILVTSTVTQDSKLTRIAKLAASGVAIAFVADDPVMVDRAAAIAASNRVRIDVLVDVDLGRGRNGVTSVEQAVVVAGRIAAAPSLRFAGIQAYASHISHVSGFAERRHLAGISAARIAAIRRAIEAAGQPVPTITGGSTGTLTIDAELGPYTELQAGSYVFSDVEYATINLDGFRRQLFVPSLFVRVSVIGRNVEGRVTCDGGNKHFSAKGTLPGLVAPPAPGAWYRPDSDEHGILEVPCGYAQPVLGSGYELVVPHCDPTVNLYDHYHVVDGDTLDDIWPIEGRGAF
jgi:D-serine deaminase-like pyridoxal phosphate-dependent protein